MPSIAASPNRRGPKTARKEYQAGDRYLPHHQSADMLKRYGAELYSRFLNSTETEEVLRRLAVLQARITGQKIRREFIDPASIEEFDFLTEEIDKRDSSPEGA